MCKTVLKTTEFSVTKMVVSKPGDADSWTTFGFGNSPVSNEGRREK